MIDDGEDHYKKMMAKKHEHSKELSKYDPGYWDAKACKRTRNGVGSLMAVTGYLPDESNKLRDSGDESGADDLFTAAEKTSGIAANVAATFSVFFKNCNWCVK